MKITVSGTGGITKLSDRLIYQTAQLSEYPGLDEIVFAPRKCYYDGTKDDYSAKLYNSKTEQKTPYFKDDFINMLDKLKSMGKLDNLDLITIVPRGEKGYSVTLDGLATLASNHLQVPYEKVIERTRAIQLKKHKKLAERLELVQGSMKISKDVSRYKKIMVIDDAKVSGSTTLEIKKILLEGGAKEIISVCLGINAHPEEGTQ